MTTSSLYSIVPNSYTVKYLLFRACFLDNSSHAVPVPNILGILAGPSNAVSKHSRDSTILVQYCFHICPQTPLMSKWIGRTQGDSTRSATGRDAVSNQRQGQSGTILALVSLMGASVGIVLAKWATHSQALLLAGLWLDDTRIRVGHSMSRTYFLCWFHSCFVAFKDILALAL